MTVCLMELGEGGLDAMEANVSIPLTTGFSPSMVFLQVKTSRIESPGWGRDLEAERERDLERVRAVSALFVSSSSPVMVPEQKISE